MCEIITWCLGRSRLTALPVREVLSDDLETASAVIVARTDELEQNDALYAAVNTWGLPAL